MEIQERIKDFVKLGEVFSALGADEPWPGHQCGLTAEEYEAFQATILREHHHNGWSTPKQIRRALTSWGQSLNSAGLGEWLAAYSPLSWTSHRVGIIMAGNIPLVGFHDLLSVLIAGRVAMVKASTDDQRLIEAAAKTLIAIDSRWEDRIEMVEGKMSGHQAVIATGSDNTARYFKQYFGHLPHIIRKSRSGVAILDGSETDEQLVALGDDIFAYYGMGCRSVNKVYVPEDFDIQRLFGGLYPYKEVIDHNKYANNYDYHKAIYLLNEDEMLENGFLLVRELPEVIASPVAVLLTERYDDEEALRRSLAERAEEIQCIVSKKDIAFGQAQAPRLQDYADGIDTMHFLSALE